MIPIAFFPFILEIFYLIQQNSIIGHSESKVDEVVCIIIALVFPFFSTIYEQLWLRHQNELSWR